MNCILRQIKTADDRDRIFNEQCEGVCPRHLPIIELLKEASAQFDK